MVAPIACSSGRSTGPDSQRQFLRIDVDRAEYAAGHTVSVSFTNVSAIAIAYSSCQARLQRLAFGFWLDMPGGFQGLDRVCVDKLEGLPAGETRVVSYLLPPAIGSGIYRYNYDTVRLMYARPASEEEAPAGERVSEPFRIR